MRYEEEKTIEQLRADASQLQARAENAEQKCAELAAALDQARQWTMAPASFDESGNMIVEEKDHLWLSEILSIDPALILADYRAQVERETLTTIGSLLGLKLCSCWEEIQQRFAPKGETDAKRD